MQPIAFHRALIRAIRDRVPPDLADFQSETYSWIAKLWFGNKKLHYECSPRHQHGVIEIGLHFEADALTNARLLGAFAAQRARVRRAVGPEVRIEEWDRGWARVWEPIPAAPLGEAMVARVADRLARYITALEPLLRDELPADVPWKPVRRRRRSGSRSPARAARGASARRG